MGRVAQTLPCLPKPTLAEGVFMRKNLQSREGDVR